MRTETIGRLHIFLCLQKVMLKESLFSVAAV